jgi:hypothetical protein
LGWWLHGLLLSVPPVQLEQVSYGPGTRISSFFKT